MNSDDVADRYFSGTRPVQQPISFANTQVLVVALPGETEVAALRRAVIGLAAEVRRVRSRCAHLEAIATVHRAQRAFAADMERRR